MTYWCHRTTQHHRCRWWLAFCLAPGHYPYQWCLIVNCKPYYNLKTSICKMSSIWFKPECFMSRLYLTHGACYGLVEIGGDWVSNWFPDNIYLFAYGFMHKWHLVMAMSKSPNTTAVTSQNIFDLCVYIICIYVYVCENLYTFSVYTWSCSCADKSSN